MSADTTPSRFSAEPEMPLPPTGDFQRTLVIRDLPYVIRGRNLGSYTFEITAHVPYGLGAVSDQVPDDYKVVEGDPSDTFPYRRHDGEIAYLRVVGYDKKKALTAVRDASHILAPNNPYRLVEEVRDGLMDTLLALSKVRDWTVSASSRLNEADREWLAESGFDSALV